MPGNFLLFKAELMFVSNSSKSLNLSRWYLIFLPQGDFFKLLVVFSILSQLLAALTKILYRSEALNAPCVSRGIFCLKQSIVSCNVYNSVRRIEEFIVAIFEDYCFNLYLLF